MQTDRVVPLLRLYDVLGHLERWAAAGVTAEEFAKGARQSWLLGTRQTEGEPAPFAVGNEGLDAVLEDYHQELSDLALAAQRGEMERDEFEREAEALMVATLLLLFSLASGSEEIPLAAVLELEAELVAGRQAVQRLADDIYVNGAFDPDEGIGRSEEDGEQKLLNRLVLWGAAAAGVWALGQLFVREEMRYVWRLGNTEEHCSTCLTLNGQVATADDWHASGFRPQGRMLECGGWRCDCRLDETGAEPTGPVSA